MSNHLEYRVVSEELNRLIQNYLLGKFGVVTEFTCQFNDDHIHLWVKLPKESALTQQEDI